MLVLPHSAVEVVTCSNLSAELFFLALYKGDSAQEPGLVRLRCVSEALALVPTALGHGGAQFVPDARNPTLNRVFDHSVRCLTQW